MFTLVFVVLPLVIFLVVCSPAIVFGIIGGFFQALVERPIMVGSAILFCVFISYL